MEQRTSFAAFHFNAHLFLDYCSLSDKYYSNWELSAFSSFLLLVLSRSTVYCSNCATKDFDRRHANICLSSLVNALNSRLYKRFSELSRLATNIECIDQLMDLLRMPNSIDEILTLISQATSPQVHTRLAELLHTLVHVSCLFSSRHVEGRSRCVRLTKRNPCRSSFLSFRHLIKNFYAIRTNAITSNNFKVTRRNWWRSPWNSCPVTWRTCNTSP